MAVLDDVRVIGLTHVIAGPIAGRILADYGADVIKIESPRRPDGLRFQEGREQQMSRSFTDFNRGTRSLALDLSDPRGRTLFLRLVAISDVLVENYSPRVMDKWGFTPDALKAINPRLIMVSMPGMGRSGPSRDHVTLGPSILSLTGLMHLWNHPDATEVVGSQMAHPDYISSISAVLAIVSGLLAREETGEGMFIDVAQLEGTAGLLGSVYLDCLLNEGTAKPIGNRHHRLAPWNCYRCLGEEAWCMITVETQEQWESLCTTLGAGSGLDDPCFATPAGRHQHRDLLDSRIGLWTGRITPEQVMLTLQAAGVPAGIVASGEQLYHDPQLRHRNFITRVSSPRFRDLELPGMPIRMSRTPGRSDKPAPDLGEHTREICLGLLGLTSNELEALVSQGVIA